LAVVFFAGVTGFAVFFAGVGAFFADLAAGLAVGLAAGLATGLAVGLAAGFVYSEGLNVNHAIIIVY